MVANVKHLEEYARLAIHVGVNLQAGQRLLLVSVPVELAPFARLLAKHAYLAGARFVDVEWVDDQQDRLRLQYASPESLHEFPDWRAELNIEYLREGDATLNVVGGDPDVLAGLDTAAVAQVNKIRAQKFAPVLDYVFSGASNWSIVAGATIPWARKVFPDLDDEAAVAALWEAIFDVCRVRASDPIAAWREHINQLQARREYLNARAYQALQFRAPGTDLTTGLPAAASWLSGTLQSKKGVRAVPNMPTEEVFTIPHREKVDGVVSSSKPLSYRGSIIDDFTLTFTDGRVVRATAASGQAALDNLLAIDEGASALGEVALVPHSSPVSRSNLLFYNTLFDENASSHIALGSSVRMCMQDGPELSEQAFLAAGGNHSLVHVDFMIGSAEMDIDGLTEVGTAEPIMRSGEWAFEL